MIEHSGLYLLEVDFLGGAVHCGSGVAGLHSRAEISMQGLGGRMNQG